MSHTIYGNKTKNGVVIDDMINDNEDIVYPVNNDYFIRLTTCINKGDEQKTALAVFSYKEPFYAIYGKELPESYEKYSDGGFTTDLFAKELNNFKEEFLTDMS